MIALIANIFMLVWTITYMTLLYKYDKAYMSTYDHDTGIEDSGEKKP